MSESAPYPGGIQRLTPEHTDLRMLLACSDEELLDLYLIVTEQFQTLKKVKAQVAAEVAERLRVKTGHRVERDGVLFRVGAGRRVVCDTEGLIEYIDDRWAEVIPTDRPRIKALQKIARDRGDDPDLVVNSFLAWKDSQSVTVKYVETKEDPF